MSELKCPYCHQPIIIKTAIEKLGQKQEIGLTKEQAEKLEVVHADGNGVYLKPRIWLKPEEFKAIADIMKELGGKWLSQGRDSCFLIPNDAYLRLTNKPKET